MLSIAPSKKFILASTSPRRRELLSQCGLQFKIESPDFEEEGVTAPTPKELVEYLANQKAKSISKKYPDAFVLGADTVVVLDGEVLGKPKSREQAIAMLSRLQGRDHLVWGGYSVVRGSDEYTNSCISKVFFSALNRSEIEAYVDTGEPMDKAGAYGAQGIGSSFVNRIEGSYTNVVGLPLAEVMSTLKKLGIVEVK